MVERAQKMILNFKKSCTDIESGAGIDGQEQGWPGPFKPVMGAGTASIGEEGGGRVVGSPRLMLGQDKEGDGCGQSLRKMRLFSTIYPDNLIGLMY
jgi:hypothetical protein